MVGVSTSSGLSIAEDLVLWPTRTLGPTAEQRVVAFSASAGIATYISPDLAISLQRGLAHEGAPSHLASRVEEVLLEAGILRRDSGGHNRNTGHRFNTDALARIARGETIRLLDLIVSEGCNFGCPHCIHSRDVATSKARAVNAHMSIDVAQRAVDEFSLLQKRIGSQQLVIHLGGAEPLVNWNTVAFVVDYVSRLRDFAETSISVNTNLSLLTPERARFLISHGVQIATSLDGDQKSNNEVRIFKDGRGTFDVILGKLNMLQDLDYALDSVTLTVTGASIRGFDVGRYLGLLEHLGMKGLALDFDLVGSADIPADEVSAFLLRVYDECVKRGLECYGTWTKPYENLFLDRSELRIPSIIGFCKAVEGGNVAVSPDGSLFMCGYTSTLLGKLGDMGTRYPEQLVGLIQERNELVRRHCAGCELIAACGGQCHTTHEVSSFEQTGKINRMCDVYREVTKQLSLRKLATEHGYL